MFLFGFEKSIVIFWKILEIMGWGRKIYFLFGLLLVKAFGFRKGDAFGMVQVCLEWAKS